SRQMLICRTSSLMATTPSPSQSPKHWPGLGAGAHSAAAKHASRINRASALGTCPPLAWLIRDARGKGTCGGLPLWSARACSRFGVRQLAAALGWEGLGRLNRPPSHSKAVASHRTPKRRQAAALELGQQKFQVVFGERAREAALAEHVADQLGLALLQVPDLLFDRADGEQAVRDHRAVLADAVRAVDGLCFDGGIPPRIEEHHVRRGGEVQPRAAGFERDEKDARIGIVLERSHHLLALRRCAGELMVADAARA